MPRSLRSHRGVSRHNPSLASRHALLPPAGRHTVLQAALRQTRCWRASAGREWRGGPEGFAEAAGIARPIRGTIGKRRPAGEEERTPLRRLPLVARVLHSNTKRSCARCHPQTARGIAAVRNRSGTSALQNACAMPLGRPMTIERGGPREQSGLQRAALFPSYSRRVAPRRWR